ncbi:MAG TPA: recombinase family protein [Pyrinomonadaceae bacterium]|jgi:site-specific DNA recombinase|nr:recombinase family protein [Pyrinomonadaceae bacterium]
MKRVAQKSVMVRTANNEPDAALIYCRVSTQKQEDEGTSLDSQTSACVAHAEKLGFNVARITKEVYSGAELFDRPLLTRDRADIRARMFQAVIVYAIDRLSRDIAHLAILSEEIERAGAKLIFVTEDLDNSPEGKLLQSVRAYVAEVERQKIRERTVRGKLGRLQSGKIHGVGPELYGYHRDKERGVRVVYEPEAQVVQRIFHLIAVESAGLLTVANLLNADGIISPWAAKGFGTSGWNATTIRNIIRNPSYKGETVQWVRRSVKRRMEPRPESEHVRLPSGVTPAIVTSEVWQRAQQRLAINTGETKRNKTLPFLLRGHIRCANCGARMYPMPIGRRDYYRRYYRCSSYVRRFATPCGTSSVPADRCEEWAWSEIKCYLQKPELIAKEVERLQSEGVDSQLLKDREIAQNALERHNQGAQRLVKRLRSADDEIAGIIERELLQATREKQSLLKTLADLDARIEGQEQAAVNLKSLYDYCRKVERELATFEFDEQRLALEALGIEVVAKGRDWRIEASVPCVVEAETISSNCSSPT